MLPPSLERPELEIDAMWSYVGHKGQVVWVWTALERHSRRLLRQRQPPFQQTLARLRLSQRLIDAGVCPYDQATDNPRAHGLSALARRADDAAPIAPVVR
jgi:IS1 family transposase